MSKKTFRIILNYWQTYKIISYYEIIFKLFSLLRIILNKSVNFAYNLKNITMSGTTSALFHLTQLVRGVAKTQFKLTADKIVNFYPINGGTNSHIEFLDHNFGSLIEHDVVEDCATISAAALTTFMVTNTDGSNFYINADRLVYLGELGTYREIYIDDDTEHLRQYKLSTPLNSIVVGAGNLGQVFLSDGTNKWLNSLYVGRVTQKPNPSDGYLMRYDSKRNEFVTLSLVASGNGFSLGGSWI